MNEFLGPSPGEVSLLELAVFCRWMDKLRPFCQPDREMKGLSTLERTLTDGRVAELSICDVKAEIPSNDDPNVIEFIDEYVIYTLGVSEMTFDRSGRGVKINKRYIVYEPQIDTLPSHSEANESYYITQDNGANWHEQRSPIRDKIAQADLLRDLGDYDKADELQREIAAMNFRARELQYALGEEPNSRARYFDARAVLAELSQELGVGV